MMSNTNMQANINQPNVSNAIPNVQNTSNAPNVSAAGQNMAGSGPNTMAGSGSNMTASNASVSNVSGPTQLPGTGQMNQMNPMMNMHNMTRGQPGNVLFNQGGSKLINFEI